MRKSILSRRTFLQASGLTASSLVLPSLGMRDAAAEVGPPLRIVFAFHEHGAYYDTWRMRMPGLPTSDQADWEFGLGALTEQEFSPSLRPLWPYRDKMMVLDGLAYLTAMGDPYGDAHAKGWCSSLTGDFARETYDGVKSHAASPSLDQIIASSLRANDPTLTDLVSLQYGVKGIFHDFHHLNYGVDSDGRAYKVPFAIDPVAAFEQLFSQFTPTPADPVAEARVDVLDAARREYEELMPRLGSEDRAKLELHREMIFDLQQRIALLANVECAPPVIENTGPGTWDGNAGEYQRWKTQAFSDMIAMAFSCRISQVATLMLQVSPGDAIGAPGEDYHHDYAHQSAPGSPQHNIDVVTNNVATHASQVALLAERLSQIPEGDGTVFDNTVILWCSELAHGGHGHDQIPIVLLGGAQGLFKMGRYLRFGRTLPRPDSGAYSTGGLVGQPHNPLLVSLAQAMGVDTNVVGKSSIVGHHDGGGTMNINLSGPLAALYG